MTSDECYIRIKEWNEAHILCRHAPSVLRVNLVENFSLPQLLNVQIEKEQIECVKQCQTEAASLMPAFHMTPFYPFSLRQKRTDRPAIT